MEEPNRPGMLAQAGGHFSYPDPRQMPAWAFDEVRHLGGAVYLLLDEEGRPLYTGQSGQLSKRLAAHRRDPERGAAAAVVFVEEPDPERRLVIETVWIAELRPPLNTAILLRVARGRLSEIRWRRKRGRSRKRRR